MAWGYNLFTFILVFTLLASLGCVPDASLLGQYEGTNEYGEKCGVRIESHPTNSNLPLRLQVYRHSHSRNYPDSTYDFYLNTKKSDYLMTENEVTLVDAYGSSLQILLNNEMQLEQFDARHRINGYYFILYRCTNFKKVK